MIILGTVYIPNTKKIKSASIINTKLTKLCQIFFLSWMIWESLSQIFHVQPSFITNKVVRVCKTVVEDNSVELISSLLNNKECTDYYHIAYVHIKFSLFRSSSNKTSLIYGHKSKIEKVMREIRLKLLRHLNILKGEIHVFPSLLDSNNCCTFSFVSPVFVFRIQRVLMNERVSRRNTRQR